MARVTVEDCLTKVENRFELVALASARATQMYKGAQPLIKTKNKHVVNSLREIAAGKVRVHRKVEPIAASAEAAS